MKKTVIGILAHVDAGKTTLSEAMLYLTGKIKSLGRVDNQNAFLDYDVQERNRGITIFSKLASFEWKNTQFTFIDTPGHSDFSSEMERTLSILDYAILVINATDGVQSHTKTIWELLNYYHVPTFIFINKMDLIRFDEEEKKAELMEDLHKNLSENCYDFTSEDLYENLALVNEMMLNEYMEKNEIDVNTINQAIRDEFVYPCYFGSALKLEGVEAFLDGLDEHISQKRYPSSLSGIVYKISRDENGNKLTHIKLTGGILKVKDKLQDEKVDAIRLYAGEKFTTVDSIKAGEVCVLKGITKFIPGDVFGNENTNTAPILSSFMNYRIVINDDTDSFEAMNKLKALEEEDPTLHLTYDKITGEIKIQLMGAIQIEILKNIILDRFKMDVDFDEGSIIYKETIKDTVEGVGHYEPLRHYAEVHLLLEPLPRDSGLKFVNKCKDEVLSKNFQRLIMTHLQEKEHIGILTGSPITDIKITLLGGRSDIKHTEGGDFRQATYRAVRQGLLQSDCILLEPYYSFELTVPSENMSKAIFDIESMKGTFEIEQLEDRVILKGKAPIKQMVNYNKDVLAYTKGKGHLYTTFSGYEECGEDIQDIIDSFNYDYASDVENPAGSIFCSHGAGVYIPWDEVVNHMHLEYFHTEEKTYAKPQREYHPSSANLDDELEEIFTRTYGKIERKLPNKMKTERVHVQVDPIEVKPECILVDGYNVIHAWEDLNEIAKESFDAAREKLIDYMASYQGYKNCLLIVVFDAYRVKGGMGSKEKRGNIHVVYTKEAQTADSYIEKATHEMSSQYRVRVATSDNLEQVIVLGSGGYRISSREFELEVKNTLAIGLDEYNRKQKVTKAYQLSSIKDYNGYNEES